MRKTLRRHLTVTGVAGAGETGAEAGEVRRGKEESVASGKGGTAVVREEEEER